jgi:hypothetical protein
MKGIVGEDSHQRQREIGVQEKGIRKRYKAYKGDEKP